MVLRKYDVLILKTNKSVVSRLIHYFTKDVYNHAALVLDNNHILEAMPTGTRITHISNDLGEFDCFRYKGTITKEQNQMIQTFIQKNVNKKYDFLALIMQAFGIKVDTPKKYICIELVVKAFEYAGINIGTWQKGFKQITNSKYFKKINK